MKFILLNFKTYEKYDCKSVFESKNLHTYAAVTYGVQEILDYSGLKITRPTTGAKEYNYYNIFIGLISVFIKNRI